MPLSAFPSTSSRMSTGQLARTLESQIASAVPIECSIVIEYVDDVQAGLERHELCVMAAFTFEDGGAISSAREDHCMSPEDWAEYDAAIERFEAEQAEQAADADAPEWASQEVVDFELAY